MSQSGSHSNFSKISFGLWRLRARLGLPSHPIFERPLPFILHDKKIVLSWSAKSASVQILLWYLIQIQLLEKAKIHHFFLHKYRTGILNRSDAYRAWAQEFIAEGASNYTLVKFVRDPMQRCVSSFRYALKIGHADAHMERILNGPINHHLGFSFDQFLEYLAYIDLRVANIHWKLQHNRIDAEKFAEKFYINIDEDDLFLSLNLLEKKCHLKQTDFSKYKEFKESARRRHAKDASHTFSGSDIFDYKLTKLDAETRWPKELLGRCELAHERVREIYQPDYAAAHRFGLSRLVLRSGS